MDRQRRTGARRVVVRRARGGSSAGLSPFRARDCAFLTISSIELRRGFHHSAVQFGH
jgi:hypothetical protein